MSDTSSVSHFFALYESLLLFPGKSIAVLPPFRVVSHFSVTFPQTLEVPLVSRLISEVINLWNPPFTWLGLVWVLLRPGGLTVDTCLELVNLLNRVNCGCFVLQVRDKQPARVSVIFYRLKGCGEDVVPLDPFILIPGGVEVSVSVSEPGVSEKRGSRSLLPLFSRPEF